MPVCDVALPTPKYLVFTHTICVKCPITKYICEYIKSSVQPYNKNRLVSTHLRWHLYATNSCLWSSCTASPYYTNRRRLLDLSNKHAIQQSLKLLMVPLRIRIIRIIHDWFAYRNHREQLTTVCINTLANQQHFFHSHLMHYNLKTARLIRFKSAFVMMHDAKCNYTNICL